MYIAFPLIVRVTKDLPFTETKMDTQYFHKNEASCYQNYLLPAITLSSTTCVNPFHIDSLHIQKFFNSFYTSFKELGVEKILSNFLN